MSSPQMPPRFCINFKATMLTFELFDKFLKGQECFATDLKAVTKVVATVNFFIYIYID